MNTEQINSLLDDKTSMNTDMLLAGADDIPSEVLLGLGSEFDLESVSGSSSLEGGDQFDINTEDITTSIVAGVLPDLNTEDFPTELAEEIVAGLQTGDITTSLVAGAYDSADLNTEDISTSIVAEEIVGGLSTEQLEAQLKDAKTRKDKVKINNKIKRIKQRMRNDKKGENHSQRHKK